jgi:hypothetical protein
MVKNNHIIIYFDAVMDEGTGQGWCVETSDSEMTVRFGTLAGALAYARTEENFLRRTPERVVI